MTISMYKVSVPVFVQSLNGLNGVLDKAAAFAEARKLDQAVVLGLRLYPDMFPLAVQVGQVTTHAGRGVALLAGLTQPTFDVGETTFAALKDRVSKTIEFVKTAKPEQIDGTEDKEIVLKFGTREMKFTGQNFLVGFTLPNFFFHYTTAYDILRSIGVEIGKRDFMGAPG
ncbi:MAG: DUF1993 domain-containing protein [Rhizomicrobium sp.]